MFFPCLENLKKEKFPEQSIALFDWWLGTRRQNNLKSLNPLQFSLDCNINIEHSLQLFAYSVFDQKINLLKQKFKLFCPACEHKVEPYDQQNAKGYTCQNCSAKISIDLLPDYTELTFELLRSPEVENERNNNLLLAGMPSGKH